MQISKKIVKILKKNRLRPVSVDELVADRDLMRVGAAQIERVLRAMTEEGRIEEHRGGYRLAAADETASGLFQASPHGYGFVITDDGDLFIPEARIDGAMHGDEVVARKSRRRGPAGKPSGEITKIVSRANKRVVGRYIKTYKMAQVTPVNKRLPQAIMIPPKFGLEADTGDIVIVEIDIWPEGRRPAQGRVKKIIGREGDPGVDIDMIVYSHDLPTEFSPKALAAAEKVGTAISPDELDGRRDLRDIFTVTIDGLDAKDFDDAVSLEIDERGHFLLWVHIADVSYYVKFGSPLDRDAVTRGTSVYLPDRVLPMLPPVLSDNICSLKPNVDRLAFSVFMDIDPEGEVRHHEIAETVIRSDNRLTYEDVDIYLNSGRYPDEKLERLLKGLELISKVLTRKRIARGSLEFETIEPKIILDERRWPVEVLIRERSPATQIIEEAMILANETVADFMWRRQAPMVYRVHERPEPEALVAISTLLGELGYPVKSLDEAHSRVFQALIDWAHNRPERLLINSVLLRTMRQARYTARLISHFGLASERYTHFTSPIRRYPDLMVHRLIKAEIEGSASSSGMLEDMEALAKHCSVREREAEQAEREAVDVKLCQFMLDKIGTVYDAVISGVSSFGFFVELPNSAEGLVHIRNLKDDYFRFEAERYLLRGDRTNKTYRLGQRLNVELVNVSVQKRELDFVVVEENREVRQK